MRVRWLLAVVVAGAAVGFVWVGAQQPDGSYSASLWANLGTTLLLALPLIVLERFFERRVTEAKESLDERIDEVQTSVGAVSDRLTELSRSTAAGIDEVVKTNVENAVGPAREIVDDPSFRSVYDAISHARRDQAAISRNVFVPVHEHLLTLSFARSYCGEDQECMSVVSIPDDPDAPKVRRSWPANESPKEFFVKLYEASHAKRGGSAPKLDPEPVLRSLAAMLEFAERRRLDAGRDARRSPLLEIPTPHWFITEAGLEHIGERPATFSKAEVRRAPVPPQSHFGLAHADELPRAWLTAHFRFIEIDALAARG